MLDPHSGNFNPKIIDYVALSGNGSSRPGTPRTNWQSGYSGMHTMLVSNGLNLKRTRLLIPLTRGGYGFGAYILRQVRR